MRLQEKAALVTRAGGGLGGAISRIESASCGTGIGVHGPSRTQIDLSRIRTGAYGTVESVANAALYLASDECLWVTGQVLNVDGGYRAAGLAYDPSEIG